MSWTTPLIPTSAQRAMAEQVVCRATTERLPSGHRAKSLGSRSVTARRKKVGVCAYFPVFYCKALFKGSLICFQIKWRNVSTTMMNDSTYCSERYEVIKEPGFVHFCLDFLQGTVSMVLSTVCRGVGLLLQILNMY